MEEEHNYSPTEEFFLVGFIWWNNTIKVTSRILHLDDAAIDRLSGMKRSSSHTFMRNTE
jgi:hypothetical protein